MFYEMRYNDEYATHANIGCENKQLRCNILKKIIYVIKATLWILDASL